MDCLSMNHRQRLLTVLSSMACVTLLFTPQLRAAEIVPPMLATSGQVQTVGYNSPCAGYPSDSSCTGCDSSDCTGDLCGAEAGCTDPGCTGCGAENCCGCLYQPCQSFWTARVSGLYMQRDRPDDRRLMQDSDTLNPTRIVNARDYEFDYQGGYDLSLIAQPQNGVGMEIRFMSVQDVSANHTTTTNTSMADPLQINTNAPTFVQDVDQVIGAYDSGFHSLELNLRRQCNDITFLLGFRYLELDEQFLFDLDGSAPPANYSIYTQNRLYGVQVGAEGTLTRCNRFRLDGVAKGGIYYNAAGHSSFLHNGVINQRASGDDDNGAFVGELGLFGVYDVTSCWSIRVGYQGLWFEDVALASDQIPATNLFTQTGIDSEGGTFFHGGVIGMELRH